MTAVSTPSFPQGFLWGVASAAHQVEGGNSNSDGWLLENVADSIFAEPSGDACDHYHRYAADIAMLASFGLNCFRTSVEWARIEPEEGTFDPAAIEHYRQVLETCRQYGIAPMVTYHHFTSPRWLLADGGWEDPRTPERFARYCEKVTAELGDLFDVACTFNEPNLPFLLGALGLGAKTPEERRQMPMWVNAAAALGVDAATVAPFQFTATPQGYDVKVAAHRLGRDAIKSVRPEIAVGWTLANSDIQAAPGGEEVAATLREDINVRFLEVSRADDFVGVQTYGRHVFGGDGRLVPAPAGIPVKQMGDEIYPQGLGSTIREAARVAGVPVYVTENGLATTDDTQRVQFLEDSLGVVADCLADGVDVRGYVVWTLLDNLEWIFGFTPKFGLVAVDRTTQERTPKPSAYRLGELARSYS